MSVATLGAKALVAILALAAPLALASAPAGKAFSTTTSTKAQPASYTVGGALAIADSGFEFLSIDGPVRLDIGRVTNESTTRTSGTVRVALYVTTEASGTAPYWIIASTDLGTLGPGFHFEPLSRTVPFVPPPDGTYYVHMGVFEYEPGACNVSDGFCLDDYVSFTNRVQVVNRQIFDAGPPPAPQALAVEYYHAAFDHYFTTSYVNEIQLLDAGAFAGWQRTGRSFKVWTNGSGGAAPVCRFFSVSFAPKSSHFYTPFTDECDIVRRNADWQFEAIAFYVEYPDANGNCTPGRLPLYRLYNDGQGGAPNHRYTTSLEARLEMVMRGWTSEGWGPLGTIACVPE